MNGKRYAWGFVLVLLASVASGCERAAAVPTSTLPNPAPTWTPAVETPTTTIATESPEVTPTAEPPVKETPQATSTLKPPVTGTPGPTPTSQVPFEETPETTPTVAVPSKGTPALAPASDAVSGRVCPPIAPVDREGQDHPSYPGWGRAVNEGYGVTVRYPITWTVYNEEANHITLCRGVANLTLAYRRQGEDVPFPWTGLPAGDFLDLAPVSIQGHEIARRALVYEGKVKMLRYRGQVGDLLLVAHLSDVATPDYTDVDLPRALQDQADQIVEALTVAQAAQTKADRLLPGWVYRTSRGAEASTLWLVDEGGWSRRMSDAPHAMLSPDGRYLIEYDEAGQEYTLRDRSAEADGLRPAAHPLGDTPERDECCYRWWPARPGVLLFNSYPAGEVGLGGEPMGAVSRVNVDGTGYEVLDASPILRYTAVAPSPDGQTLAYSDGRTGWLYRWDQGAAAFDPAEHGLAEVRDARLYSPAWSPDGSRLAWVISGDLSATDSGGGATDWNGAESVAVVVYNLRAGTAEVLFRYHQARRGYQQPAPVWSPDGRWLAFEAWSIVPEEEGMWVLPAGGSPDGSLQDEPVYLGPGSDPHWSPDSRWMAFTRVENEKSQTYVHKVRGGGAIPYARAVHARGTGARLVDWIELAPGVQPAATATPHPAVVENDVILPDVCSQTLEDTSLYVNVVDGYCLRYPARFWVGDVYPPGIANLYGPARDAYPLEPLSAGAALLVEKAAGDGSLSQAVDAWLEHRRAEPPMRRDEGLLGGQQAELVEYQGERSRAKVVFALYENKLYALSFFPDGEQFPQVARDAKALWDTVIGTFAFLPPETKAALDGANKLADAQATRAAQDEQSRALGALAQYFSLLHRGRYHEAVSAYSGDYQVLRNWNPGVPPNDHATLFQKGCTVNGLQCLAIRAIVDEQRISENEHRFTIKLARELPGEPFTYTVRKVGDKYLVQELPPYVP